MRDLVEGMFVRCWPGWKCGMLMRSDGDESVLKSGTDGPVFTVPTAYLIPMTNAQIEQMGWSGVGHIPYEQEK